jgi:hypothetical protein
MEAFNVPFVNVTPVLNPKAPPALVVEVCGGQKEVEGKERR